MSKKRKKIVRKSTTKINQNNFYHEICSLIEETRHAVASAINTGMTMLYWQIGKRINEEILKGERAEYGKEIVVSLARQLALEYGNNFSQKNLRRNDSICSGLSIQGDCRIADTTFKLDSLDYSFP